jgi:uncharacterized protein
MKCPICRKPVEMTNPEMPFCSDRCRLIDLGKWSAEEYVISAPLRPEELERVQPADRSPEDES